MKIKFKMSHVCRCYIVNSTKNKKKGDTFLLFKSCYTAKKLLCHWWTSEVRQSSAGLYVQVE